MLCVDPENIISVACLQFPLNIHISIQYLMYCSVDDFYFFFAFILKKISTVLNNNTLFLFFVSIVSKRSFEFKFITVQPGVKEIDFCSMPKFFLDLCEMCLHLCFSF